MPASIIRAIITPTSMQRAIREVTEAAAGHPTYPAVLATVTDISSRRVIA